MTISTAASNAAPTPLPSDRLLRAVLRLDAVVTAVNGAAYLLGAPLLEDLLGLPTPHLGGVGGFLLCYAAGVWAVAARPTMSTAAVLGVVAANALWAAGSVGLVAAGWVTPTTVGAVWLVLQAAVVAGFAVLQLAGLRRGR